MPVGRVYFFLSSDPTLLTPSAPTHGHFVLSLVFARLKDGGPSNSKIETTQKNRGVVNSLLRLHHGPLRGLAANGPKHSQIIE